MDMHVINQVENSHKVMLTIPDGYFNALILDPDYKDKLDPKELKRICRGNIVVFCKPENQYFQADQYMFWNKPLSTKNFGATTGRYVEMILVLRQGKTFNRLHWSQMSGVYHDLLVEAPIHPFEKPETLIQRMVRMLTNPGDLVGDFFTGSGTVPKVCKDLGRQCIGFEKDRRYVEMARQRLQGATHDQLRSIL